MAIYSFNHATFAKGQGGKDTYAAARNAAYNAREAATRIEPEFTQDGSAGSNAAYNVRHEVTHAVRAFGMPADAESVETWFREQEAGERKNARMSDRFIAALPRELTPEQCVTVVEEWCQRVTGNRVPWHFGLHLELDQKDEANWNPHAHIIIRDRDIETGKRHLNTTAGQKERRQLAEKGIKAWSTADFRQAWQDSMNHALELAGHDVRIDARSNKDRGIDAQPGVHIGRAPKHMAEKGQRPLSGKDYIHIDNGQTRLDENEKRKRRRSERPPPDTPEQRQREELNRRHGQERSDIAAAHHAERMALRSLHAAEFATRKHQDGLHNRETRNAAYLDIGKEFSARYQQVRAIENTQARATALDELTTLQAAAYQQRSSELITDAKPAKDTRWRQMTAAQSAERKDLEQHQKTEIEALKLAQDAERLALKEQQRTTREQSRGDSYAARQALRDGVALTGNQSMVNVDAVQMERLRRRAELASRKAERQPTSNPAAEAGTYRQRAAKLRSEAETTKETTDRRLDLEGKAARAVEKPSTVQKQKGKDDKEQER